MLVTGLALAVLWSGQADSPAGHMDWWWSLAVGRVLADPSGLPNVETLAFTVPEGQAFRFGGWAFDWLYDLLFVKPYLMLARVNRRDLVNDVYIGVEKLSVAMHRVVIKTQTGGLRWYAAVLAAGLVIVLALVELS